MRTHGIVRQWNADKGFGFIQGAASTQVFFHVRDFRGTAPPAHGMPVEYEEIHVGGKGPRAMDVRPRSQPSGSPSAHRSPARAASALHPRDPPPAPRRPPPGTRARAAHRRHPQARASPWR
ncbi:cold shock domain-containing protein [Diaphorobacter sp. JS3050]|uniref:cold-shock protein n=1 Tax=Diaphorobacter sp. JS3050 TaxID=2735554 RepID=UPI001552CA6F|nr:cold shock domain-containing protein [Diaphorobacter sp. JS3050]QJY33096.1 cold shock domain-containing protein [Diaphorobacter sp. JS3050]